MQVEQQRDPGILPGILPPPVSLALSRDPFVFPDSQPARPGELFRRETKDCKGSIKVYAHGDHGQGSHRWFVPGDDCCQNVHCTCPACVARWSRNKARKVRRKIERLDFALEAAKHPDRVSTLCLVFTVPKGYPTDVRETIAILRKKARILVEKWLADINGIPFKSRSRKGWRLAGFDCIHPEGESSSWHPHIHMEVLSIAYYDDAESEVAQLTRGRFYRLRVRVSKTDLIRLRAGWGDILYSVLGWLPKQRVLQNNFVGPEWPPPLSHCSVDYQYRSYIDPGKLAHRIRYDTRHFPGWRGAFRQLAWWGYMSPAACKKIGLGKDPDNEPPDKIKQVYPEICPCCGRPAQVHLTYRSGPDASIGNKQLMLERQNAPPLVTGAITVYNEIESFKYWTE